MNLTPYPNEDPNYREARTALLEAEHDLVRHAEQVAAQRRALPPGGAVSTDYQFERWTHGTDPVTVGFPELFTEHATVMMYSFMFDGDLANVCPMCTSLIDGFEGMAADAAARINFFVVAPAAMAPLKAYAEQRGWRNLQFLADPSGQYSRDYGGIMPDGNLRTKMTVFSNSSGEPRHYYSTEKKATDQGQDDRHLDMVWALWGALDLTPEGRGDWRP